MINLHTIKWNEIPERFPGTSEEITFLQIRWRRCYSRTTHTTVNHQYFSQQLNINRWTLFSFLNTTQKSFKPITIINTPWTIVTSTLLQQLGCWCCNNKSHQIHHLPNTKSRSTGSLQSATLIQNPNEVRLIPLNEVTSEPYCNTASNAPHRF